MRLVYKHRVEEHRELLTILPLSNVGNVYVQSYIHHNYTIHGCNTLRQDVVKVCVWVCARIYKDWYRSLRRSYILYQEDGSTLLFVFRKVKSVISISAGALDILENLSQFQEEGRRVRLIFHVSCPQLQVERSKCSNVPSLHEKSSKKVTKVNDQKNVLPRC